MLNLANANHRPLRRGTRALAAMTVILVGAGLYTLGAPGRTASWADLGADAMGSLLGATLLSPRRLMHRRAAGLAGKLTKHR